VTPPPHWPRPSLKPSAHGWERFRSFSDWSLPFKSNKAGARSATAAASGQVGYPAAVPPGVGYRLNT